jgi:hypothetical protein
MYANIRRQNYEISKLLNYICEPIWYTKLKSHVSSKQQGIPRKTENVS